MFQYSGLHIIIAVVVLAAIGEFTKGIVAKIAWSLAAIIVVLHTLAVFGKK